MIVELDDVYIFGIVSSEIIGLLILIHIKVLSTLIRHGKITITRYILKYVCAVKKLHNNITNIHFRIYGAVKVTNSRKLIPIYKVEALRVVLITFVEE